MRTAYQEWDRAQLALLSDGKLVRMTQERFPDRVIVLRHARGLWLLKLTHPRAGPAE